MDLFGECYQRLSAAIWLKMLVTCEIRKSEHVPFSGSHGRPASGPPCLATAVTPPGLRAAPVGQPWCQARRTQGPDELVRHHNIGRSARTPIGSERRISGLF